MRISGSVWQQQLNTEHSKTGQMELHFQKLNSGNGVPSENCSDHICRDGNIKAKDISSSLMFNSQCLLRPNRTLSGIITVTEQQCFYSIFHAYALNKEYPCEWCAVQCVKGIRLLQLTLAWSMYIYTGAYYPSVSLTGLCGHMCAPKWEHSVSLSHLLHSSIAYNDWHSWHSWGSHPVFPHIKRKET